MARYAAVPVPSHKRLLVECLQCCAQSMAQRIQEHIAPGRAGVVSKQVGGAAGARGASVSALKANTSRAGAIPQRIPYTPKVLHKVLDEEARERGSSPVRFAPRRPNFARGRSNWVA